jgi:plasmid stabilization system protein ParE
MIAPGPATPHPRRWRRWLKLGSWALAGVVATAGGLAAIRTLLASRAETRRLPRYEALVGDWTKEARIAWGPRPTVLSPVEPGNAWDDYLPAFRVISELSNDDRGAIADVVERRTTPDAVRRADAALERLAPALAQLRRGTRRAEVTPPWSPNRPPSELTPELRGARDSARILRLLARKKSEAGHAGDAVTHCLEGLQVGLDLLRGPTLIFGLLGHVHIHAAALELHSLLPSLDPTASARCARVLGAASRHAPSFYACLPGDCLAGLAGLAESPEMNTFSARVLWWYKAGSTCLLRFDVADRYDEFLRAIRSGLDSPWVAARTTYEQPTLDASDCAGVIVGLLHPAIGAAEASYRSAIARLRLLQAACLVRSGVAPGGPDWPVDPFDRNPLRFEHVEDGLLIRSVWKDGVPSQTRAWEEPDRTQDDCAVVVRVP